MPLLDTQPRDTRSRAFWLSLSLHFYPHRVALITSGSRPPADRLPPSSAVDPAQADVFDFEILFNAVARALAAQAALLDAAERRRLIGDEGLVHAHHAVFETLRHSRPLSITHALKGDMAGPVWRRKLWTLSSMSCWDDRLHPIEANTKGTG